MPELPEVETSCRGLAPLLIGKPVTSVQIRQARLRWPIPTELPDTLPGYTLRAIHRRAKYLLFEFDHGRLLIHLGMSGSLRVCPVDLTPEKHDHVDIVFAGQQCLRLRDPRRFGAVLWLVEALHEHALFKHLGPEPLLDDFDASYLYSKSRQRTVSIKQLIMDNRVVVGVGNIYASEALFMAGLRPTHKARRLSKQAAEQLTLSIKQVLTEAIKLGGTTLRDFVSGEGKPGYFQQKLQVYGRDGQACYHCGTGIKQLNIGQRSTFYCPHCQA